MKKILIKLQIMFFALLNFSGLVKNFGSAFDGLSSNYTGDEYSDYTGVVRKLSELTETPVDQFSFTLTNTTGKNLNVALTNPRMVNSERVAIPDTGNIKANGGGLIGIGANTEPIKLYDMVDNFKPIKGIDAIVGDGIHEATTDACILYANTVNPTTARLIITADNLPVSYFINQMNDDKFIVESIDIDVNDRSVITGSSLLIKDINCFNTQGEKIIKLKDFINNTDLQDKRIKIDTVEKYGYLLQLDRKSLISLYMPGLVNGTANTIISIQFNVKKVLDDAQSSIKAAVREYTTLKRTGEPTTKFQAMIQRKETANALENSLINQLIEKQKA